MRNQSAIWYTRQENRDRFRAHREEMDEQGYSSCWIILSLSVIQQGRRQNKSTWHSFDCQVLRLKRECRKDGKRKERAQMEMRGKRASDGKRENSCQFWWPLTEKLKVCEIAVFPSPFLSLFPQRGMPKYDERLAWVAVTWHSTPSTRNPFCCHTLPPLGVNCCNLCYASLREVRRRRRAAVGAFMLKQVYLTLEKCAGDCFNPFKACTHLSASVPSTPHHSDGSFSWNQVNGDINIFLRGYVTSYLVCILYYGNDYGRGMVRWGTCWADGNENKYIHVWIFCFSTLPHLWHCTHSSQLTKVQRTSEHNMDTCTALYHHLKRH